LVMMNDPTVLEASRVLAQKLMDEKSTIDEKIAESFRLILCRKASAKELMILKNYYLDELQNFQQKKSDAHQILNIGEYPIKKTEDRNTLAALMKTINTIYNLEEAITKT